MGGGVYGVTPDRVPGSTGAVSNPCLRGGGRVSNPWPPGAARRSPRRAKPAGPEAGGALSDAFPAGRWRRQRTGLGGGGGPGAAGGERRGWQRGPAGPGRMLSGAAGAWQARARGGGGAGGDTQAGRGRGGGQASPPALEAGPPHSGGPSSPVSSHPRSPSPPIPPGTSDPPVPDPLTAAPLKHRRFVTRGLGFVPRRHFISRDVFHL